MKAAAKKMQKPTINKEKPREPNYNGIASKIKEEMEKTSRQHIKKINK